jgi:rubrerythrin
MAKPMTIGQAFEVAIAAEKTAEALYQALGSKFAAQADVANFLRYYARDEVEHAGWLQMLRSQLVPEVLSRPVEPDIADSLAAITDFSAEAALKGVRSLEDAFQLICEMESGETNAIARFLIVNFEPDEQLRKFLENQLVKHIGKISLSYPAESRGL